MDCKVYSCNCIDENAEMGKTATAFVIDISSSMQNASKLFKTVNLVQRLINPKIIKGLKGDLVAVVLVGATHSNNKMFDGDSEDYAHISVLQELENPTLDLLKNLNNLIEFGNKKTDIVDGIIVAADLIMTHCKKLKYDRRIYVLSDGQAAKWKFGLDKEAMVETVAPFQDFDIRIDAVDCRDLSEINEELAVENWNRMSDFLKLMQKSSSLNASKSLIFTIEEAMESVVQFKPKGVGTLVALYKGALEIGLGEDVLIMQVAVYSRTSKVALPSFKLFSQEVDEHGFASSQQATEMKRDFTYKKAGGSDEISAAEPEESVQKTDLTNVYQYGSNSVPIPADYQGAEPEGKSMRLTGFVKRSQIDRNLFMDKAMTVMALPLTAKSKHEDQIQLNRSRSLLRILNEQLIEHDVYALVRYVANDRQEGPKMAVLSTFDESVFQSQVIADDDEEDSEVVGKFVDRLDCLCMNILPFQEDVRQWKFRSLPLLTQAGSHNLSQTQSTQRSSQGVNKRRRDEQSLLDRFAPTEAQLQAMEKFIGETQLVGIVDEGDQQ